jgi:DNA (cytosine-5)-methyltransferase 1
VLPAASVIDWSDLGQRIGDRARPLAAATMRRIEMGVRMFARPAVVQHAGQTWDAAKPGHRNYGQADAYYRAWAADNAPLMTRQAGGSGDALMVPPFYTAVNHDADDRARTLDSGPLPTRSTKIGDGLVFSPSIVEMYGTSTARSIDDPLSTVTAGGNHHGLTFPPDAFLSKHHGGLDYARIEHMNKSVTGPMPTIVGRPNVSLVIPSRKRPATMHEGDLPFSLDDVQFRMLGPTEHLRAQRFWEGYDTSSANKSETTKGAGNAVPVNAANFIGGYVKEALS